MKDIAILNVSEFHKPFLDVYASVRHKLGFQEPEYGFHNQDIRKIYGKELTLISDCLKEAKKNMIMWDLMDTSIEGALLLIRNGADPENKGTRNISPRELARIYGLKYVESELIKAIAIKI